MNKQENQSEQEYEHLIINWLRNKDQELAQKCDKKRYQLICLKTKTIIFKNRKYLIKRRYYFDNYLKQHVFLLDEWLCIKHHQHVSVNQQEEICQMLAINKMSFEQVLKAIQHCISRTALYRLIRKQNLVYDTNFECDPKTLESIYVDIDDTFRNLKVNNHKQKYKFKMLHIYQNFIKDKKHFVNEVKALLINECHMNSYKSMQLTITQIKTILKQYYGNYRQFKIQVNGDGARYINSIAKSLHAKVCLDKWHLFHKVRITFNIHNLNRNYEGVTSALNLRSLKLKYCHDVINLLKLGQVDKALELLAAAKNDFKNYASKCQEINGLIYYIKRNKNAIKIWQEKTCFGVHTETFIQSLVKSYFGDRGKCYSLTTFLNLLKTNCCVFLLV